MEVLKYKYQLIHNGGWLCEYNNFDEYNEATEDALIQAQNYIDQWRAEDKINDRNNEYSLDDFYIDAATYYTCVDEEY